MATFLAVDWHAGAMQVPVIVDFPAWRYLGVLRAACARVLDGLSCGVAGADLGVSFAA